MTPRHGHRLWERIMRGPANYVIGNARVPVLIAGPSVKKSKASAFNATRPGKPGQLVKEVVLLPP